MHRLIIFIVSILLIGVGLVALAPRTYAVDVLNPVCQNADPNNLPAVCRDNKTNAKDTENPIFGPRGVLTIAINLLSLLVGVISVFVIIVSGVKFVTSSGDPSSVTSARNTLLYAIIALVIAGAAQAIVHFVLIKLTQV